MYTYIYPYTYACIHKYTCIYMYTHLLLRESGGRLARSRSSVLIALRLSFDVLLVSPPPISLLFLFSSFFWRRYLKRKSAQKRG